MPSYFHSTSQSLGLSEFLVASSSGWASIKGMKATFPVMSGFGPLFSNQSKSSVYGGSIACQSCSIS
ncbi:MAG TPA: hypothetical protein DEF79_05115 [Gammaproteobacteria bacterium]|nr:hypothetical protein [Gammaproteobacteria bacterium]